MNKSRELELAEIPSGGESPALAGLAALSARLVDPFRRGDPPPPRPATGFFTDTTICIGCKACEVACKQWNQLPSDGFNWTGNSYDNTGELSGTSWRHVKFIEQFSQDPVSRNDAGGKLSLNVVPPVADAPGSPASNRWLMMSDVCKHCVASPCHQACPTGAIIQNEFENVYIQADICNGCSYCVAACPFGVITRASFDGHSHKCTLCYDRQKDDLVPACAKACPTASIQFGPIDELRERASRRVEELRSRGIAAAHLYGDAPTETYSSLNSFYLLADRPSVYGLPDQPFNPWLNMGGDYMRGLIAALLSVAVLVAVFLLHQR